MWNNAKVAKHNEIGRIGEEVAANFLKKKGFKILARNYWKPYGEIDIVAYEKGKVHFVEVKTVSCEMGGKGDPVVSGETSFRPEENAHPQKLKRLSRVIQSYIISHETGDWQFDVVAVYIDKNAHRAKVRWIKDIVIGT